MSQDNRLNNLLTYTTFHIGVYISLTSALIGLGIFKDRTGDTPLLKWSILCVMLAGVCGGVIGSNIPEAKSYDEYWNRKIGFWSLDLMRPAAWVRWEHLFFWAGVLPLGFGYLLCGADAF